MIPFIAKSNSITLFPTARAAITIDDSHINFKVVQQAIADNDFDKAVELADVPAFVTKMAAGRVQVSDAGVLFDGEPMHNCLTQRMLDFMTAGLPFQHYCKFLDNLMDNQSMTSRNELYLFLEAANLPITEDGCFLAYKAVRSDFKDKHTGKFDNNPGAILEMPRRNVNDDRNVTCSYGFHAAAYDYAKNFMSADDKMVAVKINPADVVSVPSDYKNQKLRTCRYQVMYEIEGAADTLTGQVFVDTSSDDPEYSDYEMGYDDAVDGRPSRNDMAADYYHGYADGVDAT